MSSEDNRPASRDRYRHLGRCLAVDALPVRNWGNGRPARWRSTCRLEAAAIDRRVVFGSRRYVRCAHIFGFEPVIDGGRNAIVGVFIWQLFALLPED
jgi:hypothetical protein